MVIRISLIFYLTIIIRKSKMYFPLFSMSVLIQQCIGIYINISNGETNVHTHSNKAFKPPDGMVNDQGSSISSDGDSSLSDATAIIDFFSRYIYGSAVETTPVPIGDVTNSNIPPKVFNKGAELSPSKQPESQQDLQSFKELNHITKNELQDVLGAVENFTVNQVESQVDVDVETLEEPDHPPNNNTQDTTKEGEELSVTQQQSQFEAENFDNKYVAQWVATIIFITIGSYAIIFIIAVLILECKGEGKRTKDDGKYSDKYGLQSEKQKLLNGGPISEDTKYYQCGDEFDNSDIAYGNAALEIESSPPGNYNQNHLLADRSNLHHLLGSPEAEVEVFPHGSLPRPPKKGCLQY